MLMNQLKNLQSAAAVTTKPASPLAGHLFVVGSEDKRSKRETHIHASLSISRLSSFTWRTTRCSQAGEHIKSVTGTFSSGYLHGEASRRYPYQIPKTPNSLLMMQRSRASTLSSHRSIQVVLDQIIKVSESEIALTNIFQFFRLDLAVKISLADIFTFKTKGWLTVLTFNMSAYYYVHFFKHIFNCLLGLLLFNRFWFSVLSGY